MFSNSYHTLALVSLALQVVLSILITLSIRITTVLTMASIKLLIATHNISSELAGYLWLLVFLSSDL